MRYESWNGTLDTRMPCESENAKVWPRENPLYLSVAGLPPQAAEKPPFISLRDRAKKDRAKLTTEDKTDFSDTACGRARLLAGRMAPPIDEASIPPGIVRPARSRALP